MEVFERKRYKGGCDGQHRKDIQRNVKQGKNRKELYRVVLDREGGKTGLPTERAVFRTVHSKYRKIPKEKTGRRNYNRKQESIRASIRR